MWNDIIEDEIYIGQTPEDLNEELRVNTWHISMSDEERLGTSLNDLLSFFHAVIDNRRTQIQRSNTDQGMWFYVWHDRQASQLRFSLISTVHQRLPFGAVTISTELEAIVEEFLNSSSQIPWSVLNVSDYDPEEVEDDSSTSFGLSVFSIQLL